MSDFKTLGAALLTRGYRIIPIEGGKKGPKLKDWENLHATQEDVRKWASNGYASGNIGVLTEETPAIDLDILDKALALEMEAYIVALLGDAPVRVGRAPKRLLVFRTDEPFRKQTSARFTSPNGDIHRVEVLGVGQQFVSYGIHPDTHKPYDWISFEELKDIDASSLPTLTVTQAKEVVREFERRAKARGWTSKGRTAERDESELITDMKQPLLLTDDEITEALSLIGDNDDYDNWCQVGMALHHQFGGGQEGLQLWIDWSRTAINFDEEALVKRWSGSFQVLPGVAPTTFATVLKMAKDNKQQAETEMVEKLREQIETVESETELMRKVVPEIGKHDVSEYDTAILIDLVRKKVKKLAGSLVSVRIIKDVIAKAAAKEHTGKEELEVVLAKHVMRHHYADGKHVKRLGDTWWVYRGGIWRREDNGMVQKCIFETLTRLGREKNKDVQAILKEMKESRGDQLNALVTTLFSMLGRMVSESSEDDPLNLKAFEAPCVMNCLNGELWFDEDGTMTFTEHDSDHKLTNQLACEYDEDGDCPTFKRSLAMVFQGCDKPDEVIRHFCEVIGYILQPTRDTAIWVMFKGPGSNGKTFLLDIVSCLMGPRAVLPMALSELSKSRDPHFVDSLVGKLMLLDDDLQTNTLLPDDWLKKLSEGKQMTANPKNHKPFSFTARALPFVLTNTWPSTVDMSEGLQRRIIAFEANHKLRDDEKDPKHRKTILAKELPGVLNLFAEGFQRFLERGSKFDVPLECQDAKSRLMENANPIVRFKKTMLVPDHRQSVKLTDMYERYTDWVRHWEYTGTPLGRNKFYNAMESLGLMRVNHSGIAKYKGIRMLAMPNLEEAFDDLDDLDL